MCRLLISDVVASLWTPQRLPLTWSNTLLLLIMQRHSTVFPTASPPVRVCCITIHETNRASSRRGGTQRKPGTRDDACKNVTPLVFSSSSSPSASAPPLRHTLLSSFLDMQRRRFFSRHRTNKERWERGGRWAAGEDIYLCMSAALLGVSSVA